MHIQALQAPGCVQVHWHQCTSVCGMLHIPTALLDATAASHCLDSELVHWSCGTVHHCAAKAGLAAAVRQQHRLLSRIYCPGVGLYVGCLLHMFALSQPVESLHEQAVHARFQSLKAEHDSHDAFAASMSGAQSSCMLSSCCVVAQALLGCYMFEVGAQHAVEAQCVCAS